MQDNKDITLYELLGVSPTADQFQIKKAFRKKALACHPDKNLGKPNAEKLFVQLYKARELLLNSQKRALYDMQLRDKQANNRKFEYQRNRMKQQFEDLLFARRKFQEELKKKEEMRRKSQQEEFARQAKIRELLKKMKQQYEKVSSALPPRSSTFARNEWTQKTEERRRPSQEELLAQQAKIKEILKKVKQQYEEKVSAMPQRSSASARSEWTQEKIQLLLKQSEQVAVAAAALAAEVAARAKRWSEYAQQQSYTYTFSATPN